MVISRRETRILIIQTLFENDFHKREPTAESLIEVFNTLARQNNPGLVDNEFARKVLEGIASKYDEINEIIEQAAPNWPLEKIGSVDRNILRLGVFEILFGKEFSVPGRVALNEAVEITKIFLNTSARKFINGVLGAVYKETGDADNDEFTNAIRVKKSAGGVVFRIDKDGNLKFAFVYDVFGKWTLSKGGLESGEPEDKGFERVIKDELGINVKSLERIGSNSYIAHPPEGTVRKEVSYMLGQTQEDDLNLKESGGLEDARWFTQSEVKTLPLYSDLKQVIFDGMDRAMELSGKK